MTTGPQNDYSLSGGKLNLSNAGIVIGRITGQRHFGLGSYDAELSFGRDICFKDLSSNKLIVYGFAKEFQILLPEGDYEFYGIANPTGHLLIPKDRGFIFTVKRGEIIYIGSIVGDRDLKEYLQSNNNNNIPHAIYGLSNRLTIINTFERDGKQTPNEQAGNTLIDFYVIDENEKIISQFIAKNTSYSRNAITTSLMKNKR